VDLTKLAQLADIVADWEGQAADMNGLELALSRHVPVAALTARGRARQLTDCAADLRDFIRKEAKR
jgi:hypothetical protein